MQYIRRLFALGMLVLLPTVASAAVFEAGDQVSVIDDVADDAYVAGALVNIRPMIGGDLFAAGANVNVTGDVSDDLFAAGSSVIIAGMTGDDLRVAGSNVIVSGDVGDDIFAAGSVVQIDGNVGGDAHLAGAMVVVNGRVEGSAFFGGSTVVVNGTIGGDVTISAEEMTFGENGEIVGTLTYYAPEALSLDGVKAGAIVYAGPAKYMMNEKASNDAKGVLRALASIWFVSMMIGCLIVSLLLGLVFPKASGSIAHDVLEHGGATLGTGLVVAIVAPVVTILLLVTGIGIPLAAGVAILGAALGFLTAFFTVIVSGNVLVKWMRKTPTVTITWYGIVLGLLVVMVLKFIPILGWIVLALLHLTVLGAVARFGWKHVEALR